VQRGDNPGEIAGRFRISTSNLCEWNNIRHNIIRTGQRLTIYVNGGAPLAKTESAIKKADVSIKQAHSEIVPHELQSTEVQNTLNGEYTLYTVRNGDSLYTIAKQFAGVSDLEIKLLNKIKNARSIVPGQKLKIPVKA